MTFDKKVLLVDGTSHIFRAYHRMGSLLTAPDGTFVGALYIFCLMLKKLLKDYPKTPIVLFFDQGGKNFRHEIYPEYKANRSKPDDDLLRQMALCHQVAANYGFPIVKRHGVEADDLIGTVAKAYSQIAFVEIHSPDKDFLQLVNDQVHVIVEEKTGYKIYDNTAVIEKYSIGASQFRDFLALKGDQSDNIPGLKGCGDKTASKWLQTYSSLDNLVAHKDQITGKIGDKLRENIEDLKLSQQLVTIDSSQCWPSNLDANDLPPPPYPDQSALKEMFELYDFQSLLPSVDIVQSDTLKHISQTLVETFCAFEDLVINLKSAHLKAFDLETTSLSPLCGEIVGLSFCWDLNNAAYVPLSCFSSQERQKMKEILNDLFSSGNWIAHNFKFDAKFLRHQGYTVAQQFEDTLILAHLLESSGSLDLKTLANKILSWPMKSFKEVLTDHKVESFDKLPLEQQSRYACLDAAATFYLYEHFQSSLKKFPKLEHLYHLIEKPFVKTLVSMELRGVYLDTSYLLNLSKDFIEQKQLLQQQIYALAGEQFNIGSTKQLRSILYDTLKLPVRAKTPKGLPSTNESALDQLQQEHQIATYLLQWRELDKLLSTYTDSLIKQVSPVTGAIHTQYHQTGTITGRLSSSDPNLQNIPIKTDKGRQIRSAFIARPGFSLIAADYSQIELRLMAHFSQDESLLEAYKRQEDVHRLTASKIFDCPQEEVTGPQRQQAKVVNFGLIYGMTPWGLSKQLKISLDEAQNFHQRFFDKYPAVKVYMDKMQENASKFGYVETLLGRRIPVRAQSQGSGSFRASINGPLQGTASDLIKQAMINFQSEFAESQDIYLLMQVHDELVFEVSHQKVQDMIPAIEKIMVSAMQLTVPLDVNINYGLSWEQAHA